jgi:Zn-dependent protease with chaperone function
MPSDQGVLKDKVLYLPGELKGRLEQDELDPLIGSSLIRHSDPRIRLKESLAFTGFVTIPLFLLRTAMALIGPILEPGTIVAGVVTLVLVMSAFVIIFGGGYLLARTERSFVLESDRKTAGLIGKEPLLRTLKKLAEMDLPDQRRLKKRRNYLLANYDDSYKPSIDDRIQSLLKQ